MRALLFLVSVLQFVFGGVTLGSEEQGREIMLIRRAYLDVAGVLPTAQEIDWFVVYNKHGYELAVDYLFGRYYTRLVKEYVLSDAYKNQPFRLISESDFNKNLLYVVGMKEDVTSSSIQKAKNLLISQAIASSDNVDETIDYLCNTLMSRSSNLQENNILSHKFKDACVLSNKQTAWLLIVDSILMLHDVHYK